MLNKHRLVPLYISILLKKQVYQQNGFL